MAGFTYELDLPPGINSDDTTFAAKGRWADGSNVRFVNGKPEVIEGWTRQGTYTLAGTCTDICWVNGGASLALGTTTKLYIVVDGTLYDITPAGFTSTTRWSLATWGAFLLAAPKGGKLYEWLGNTASPATEVTQAPSEIVSMIVTPERQVLALGCTTISPATLNSRAIRGCDFGDYTAWTPSSSNNAFEHILEATAGIVAGKMLGPYLGVWTADTFHVGQFIGDPSQTYRFDRISDNSDAIAARAIVVHNMTAWWVTAEYNFLTFTIGGAVEKMPCQIFEDWRDNQGAGASSIHGTYMPEREEIWFFYHDSRDTGSIASRYVAFGKTGTWFRGQMKRSAMNNEFSIRGVDENGYHQKHGGSTTADGAALNWYITSADQYIESGRRRVMISRCIPDFEGQVGDVSLTFYTKDSPQGSSITKGPYTLSTTTTKKDLRLSGKLMSIKLSGGATTGSYMRLGKPVLEGVTMGGR